MDESLAHRLAELTNEFYASVHASFSSTRRGAWPGWGRCLRQAAGLASADGLHLLDVACGNLRLEDYLASTLEPLALSVDACDACDALVPARDGVRFFHLDAIDVLFSRDSLEDRLAEQAPWPADLTACFGFLHHVPLREQREDLLEALVGRTRPGGLVCISFWRFLEDDRLARKADASTRRACTELGIELEDAHDRLLGWQNRPGVFRYCHSFTDEEVDGLAARLAPRAEVADRFCADGRTGALNRYLVLRRR